MISKIANELIKLAEELSHTYDDFIQDMKMLGANKVGHYISKSSSLYIYFEYSGVTFAIRFSDHPEGMSSKPLPSSARNIDFVYSVPNFKISAKDVVESLKKKLNKYLEKLMTKKEFNTLLEKEKELKKELSTSYKELEKESALKKISLKNLKKTTDLGKNISEIELNLSKIKGKLDSHFNASSILKIKFKE